MTQSLKSIIRPLVPEWLAKHWRQRRYEAEQAHYKNRPLNEVFEEIYADHVWDRTGSTAPFRSGPGSRAAVTADYEAFVIDHIMRHPDVKTLVDIGCGDFQVSHRILDSLAAQGRKIDYVGCDIAANVIDYNTRTFAAPGVAFTLFDATSQVPPEGDLVTVREVFQHLSNAHILAAIGNLREKFGHAIITESLTSGARTPNVDIVSGYRTRDGYGSGVFVDEPPFSLAVVDELVSDAGDGHRLRTTLVAL